MSWEHDRAGLNGARWKRLRRRILERDNWTCQVCGKSAGRFEIDHVVPLAAGGSAWEESNLQCLCRRCHFEKTAGENQTIAIARRPADRAAWNKLIYQNL